MTTFGVPGNFDMTSPAVQTIDIVPSDTDDLATVVKSLWINSDGVIVGISPYDDVARTYTVFGGSTLPIAFKKILTASTAQAVGIIL